MTNIEERKAIWEKFHKDKNLAALSGCQLNETLDSLQVRDLIEKENGLANVLEVGVGLGYVTEGLNKIAFVSALDISEEALRRVASYCIALYKVEEIEDLPIGVFHVILATNIAQHIPPELFRIELYYLIRSLRSDGVLALEYVSSIKADEIGIPGGVGEYCRSPKLMESIVDACGGIMEEKSRAAISIAGSNITGAHFVHIRKKSDYV